MIAPAADLLIVIVNYRSADLALDCLASLEAEVAARPGTHVAIVENDSGADQWDRLDAEVRRRGWQGWATLMAAGRNGGFAAGNNVAIRWGLTWPEPPRLVWLLNPDTIVRPGALASLVAFLDREPGVGLVGSRLEDPDGTAQVSAFRFTSVLGELEGGMRLGLVTRLLRGHAVVRAVPDAPTAVDWVAGASLMIRRAVIEAVGLLDEGYFMYFEEVDFCRRARAAGWPCWYLPASRVVHLVGRSSGVTAADSRLKRLPRYWFEARNRYLVTHHGRWRARLANLLHWGGTVTYHVRRRLQGKPLHEPRSILWDSFRYTVWSVKR